jgi:hypothetical protein
VKKQKLQPVWKEDVDEVVEACRHVGQLALELEMFLARELPPIDQERLDLIRKLLLRRMDIIEKMMLLTILAERDAEVRRARGQRAGKRTQPPRGRSPRRAPTATTQKIRRARSQSVKPSAN